jgi:plastocyanin
LVVAAVVATACGASVRGTTASPHATAPAPTATSASLTTTTAAPPRAGAQRLHFKYGPITIQPGQNAIQFSGSDVPKPAVDGWIVRIAPNLERADGSVPAVDVIHLHHGVWLNLSRPDSTFPGPERLFAVGEEKTVLTLPAGFGYRYQATDQWRINYMIHDLVPSPDQVWITYDIDFIPATSPQSTGIREARPIWMDVQNGKIYPVFDALQGTGVNGRLTYPDDVPNAYPTGQPLNQWTVDRPGVLISTAGHLHPGGLYDDLSLTRAGASAPAGSAAAAAVTGDTARLFRSDADYFEPAGAVSWDVSMTATPQDWRVAVRPGDVLKISATYDTSQASWYEVMGIMVVWMADGTDGADPFQQRVDVPGVLTHGHLPENNHHGGVANALGDPRTFPTGPASTALTISDFTFEAGDFSEDPSPVPTVKQGQSLTFDNLDAPKGLGIWHTITACAVPCNSSTGIAYPRANGNIQFDSGELGDAGPPTAGRTTWSTPGTLPPGLYTYFCRIHPFMRGAFRVVPAT